MSDKNLFDKVNAALDEVREYIHSDGGDIELVKVENNIAYVKLKGSCVGCPMSIITLQMGVMEAIQEHAPEIVEIVNLEE